MSINYEILCHILSIGALEKFNIDHNIICLAMTEFCLRIMHCVEMG